MVTEFTTRNTSTGPELDLAIQVIGLLKKSQKELEEYFSLMAKDEYSIDKHLQDIKADLITALTEIKRIISNNDKIRPETISGLSEKVRELEKQVIHVAVGTQRSASAHLSGLRNILNEIFADLNNDPEFDARIAWIGDFINRLKIKLNILLLKMELGKMDFTHFYHERKSILQDKIELIHKLANKEEKKLEINFKKIRSTMRKAYDHLNNIFTKK